MWQRKLSSNYYHNTISMYLMRILMQKSKTNIPIQNQILSLTSRTEGYKKFSCYYVDMKLNKKYVCNLYTPDFFEVLKSFSLLCLHKSTAECGWRDGLGLWALGARCWGLEWNLSICIINQTSHRQTPVIPSSKVARWGTDKRSPGACWLPALPTKCKTQVQKERDPASEE